jgi:hypothetical protein
MFDRKIQYNDAAAEFHRFNSDIFKMENLIVWQIPVFHYGHTLGILRQQ